VNLPEFDWPLGHILGASADGWFAWKLMTKFDADVGAIEAQLQHDHVLKDTLFVITADHGMLSLHHHIPHEDIQNAVTAAGTSLADYDYHSSGYLWLRDHTKAAAVAAKILALRNPDIRAVYYRKPRAYTYVRAAGGVNSVSAATDGAYQFLLGTLAGSTAPHVVLMLKENTSIRGRNEVDWKGDHGGGSWNAEHIPLIISGPGVRQGVYSPYPATIYDIAPTVLDMLGASSVGMDGVVLADGLIQPYEGSDIAQGRRRAALQPITDALREQSHLDGP
jgi:arylsulfatase A-like enzyme